ncbi:MAG: hypothetical protein KatS3mg115_2047 [Candidatus Poribacteria bacterium]|nr:MAG: hypothetical protein KatS3mg115_2047 [Candidatus Poribacteria bacterium]
MLGCRRESGPSKGATPSSGPTERAGSASPSPEEEKDLIVIDLTPYQEQLGRPGAGITVQPREDLPLLIVRTERGHLRAFINVCTHAVCPLLPDPERRRILCDPQCGHGAEFSLSGEVLVGPATRRLFQFLARESPDRTRLIVDLSMPL